MAAKQTAAPPTGVNFGDLSMYSGGGGIAPGSYALEFIVQMFEAKNAQGISRGAPRLGVMVHAHSLTDPTHRGDNAYTQFYSMGGSADKSFAPNAETGKGLVSIPGAAGSNLNNQTNWFYLFKSLLDSGLPSGVFTNDFSTIDGVHVTMAQVDEPEERRSFASKTTEASDQPRNNKISIVTEILDDGKPWEGTGGIPGAEAPVNAPVAKGPVKVAPKAKAAPVAAAPASDEADVLDAAANSATAVLGKSLQGMAKLLFRTGAFEHVKATYGDDMAQAVQNQFFTSDANMNALLAQLGYGLTGPSNAMVKPL